MTRVGNGVAMDSVIVDVTQSENARFRPVAITAVTLEDAFWQPRRKINRDVMLPAQFDLCERTGRFANFRRAAGLEPGEYQGQYYNDSDVYKLLESASWALAGADDPELEALVNRLIDDISAAQQPDGYLHTYFTLVSPGERWTNFDLHEMYCAGHLFQAAVAHYRSTGETRLLDVARRFADHICERFGPEAEGKQFGNDGHPEIEMALVELYRATGDRKYLEESQYLVGNRGYGRVSPNPYGRFPASYGQDHVPFAQSTRLEGHAVRAVYLNCGATDIAAETDAPELRAALDTMWDSMVLRQMYIHGGLGPRHENEGFGPDDYELPNHRAHAETCASVANVMWNWRLLLLTGEARYADLMEQTLYNSVLSGVSLDGKGYFYQNPLSDNGTHRRQTWFTTACCPGNVSRTLAQLPGYFYTTSDSAVWVHLYGSNRASLPLADGTSVQLVQRTDYPWSGEIAIEVATAASFDLHLRLPGWCVEGWRVALNGSAVEHEVTAEGYIRIRRMWQVGDVVTLALPMQVRQITSHPLVAENHDRVALMRGPLLYCLEGVDHSDTDIRLIELGETTFVPEHRSDLLNGVTVLHGEGRLLDTGDGALYSAKCADAGAGESVRLMAIPYYAWANREPGPMRVWLPTAR